MSNTATGFQALFSNDTGNFNAAIGDSALFDNTIGVGNTAVGSTALSDNTEGNTNTAIGNSALDSNTIGSSNTAVGSGALSQNTTGSDNVAMGVLAGHNVTTAANVICVGTDVEGQNVSNSCYIGNIWGQSGGSQAVYVNADGKLGAQVSSRRFKDEIEPMEKASEVIYRLKPVSFRYKPEIEPARSLGFGLIAEDVEQVSPDLVACDKEGKPYSVRYDQVNAMLLNEFLKEHRKVEEQQATIAELKSELHTASAQQQREIQTLTSRLEEQAAQIQKVSAQLEVIRPATKVVVNKP